MNYFDNTQTPTMCSGTYSDTDPFQHRGSFMVRLAFCGMRKARITMFHFSLKGNTDARDQSWKFFSSMPVTCARLNIEFGERRRGTRGLRCLSGDIASPNLIGHLNIRK